MNLAHPAKNPIRPTSFAATRCQVDSLKYDGSFAKDAARHWTGENAREMGWNPPVEVSMRILSSLFLFLSPSGRWLATSTVQPATARRTVMLSSLFLLYIPQDARWCTECSVEDARGNARCRLSSTESSGCPYLAGSPYTQPPPNCPSSPDHASTQTAGSFGESLGESLGERIVSSRHGRRVRV
jgi:hypothetical protein